MSRVRSDIATAATRCRQAVGLLLNVAGAGSFAQANPLQRIWRDLEIISRHGLVNVDIGREIYGRALLGYRGAGQPAVLNAAVKRSSTCRIGSAGVVTAGPRRPR